MLCLFKCRGEHRSSAEKQSFRFFRLTAIDFAWQNQRATNGRPYDHFFDRHSNTQKG